MPQTKIRSADFNAEAWVSYTPTVSATSGSFTSASATGAYIQYGKTVHWRAVLTQTTVGTASGGLLFTLPVAAKIAGAVGQGRERAVNGLQNTCYTTADNSTTCQVQRYDNQAVIGSGFVVAVSGSYEAN